MVEREGGEGELEKAREIHDNRGAKHGQTSDKGTAHWLGVCAEAWCCEVNGQALVVGAC